MDQAPQDRLREVRATLQSAWWKTYCESLLAREAKLRDQLETGSEPRLEDRQRGALAALKWARTFLDREVRMLQARLTSEE